MQIMSEYKFEEIKTGKELVSISFIYSEIAVIVNPLTYKSQSRAPYIRSNSHENNNFKAITFR